MFSLFKKDIPSIPLDLPESEQKTPKAGYVLLLAMVIAALFFGWRAIDDLADVPQKPERLSTCSNEFIVYSWEDAGRFGNYPEIPPYAYDQFAYVPNKESSCVFSHLEVVGGILAVFEQRKSFDLQLKNLELQLNQTNNSISDYERQYNLGLQEKIAEEQRKLYPIPVIQQNLEPLRQKRADIEIQVDKIKADRKPIDDTLKIMYRELLPKYRNEWRWYEFKVFLLEALFVVPFFWFSFWMYRRLLFRKSPYTIIFTALVGVGSILMLRIFFAWFWNLLLARIIQVLWDFIQNFAILKSLVFYGGMLASIAIFGGAVYLLQKHIFDPRRVALRSLKHNKCPQCEFSLDIAEEFCPNCGRHIREKCTHCGKTRFIDFSHCPHCGTKK